MIAQVARFGRLAEQNGTLIAMPPPPSCRRLFDVLEKPQLVGGDVVSVSEESVPSVPLPAVGRVLSTDSTEFGRLIVEACFAESGQSFHE